VAECFRHQAPEFNPTTAKKIEVNSAKSCLKEILEGTVSVWGHIRRGADENGVGV
jgi:hypothetical protein